jgi:hypothetical protein
MDSVLQTEKSVRKIVFERWQSRGSAVHGSHYWQVWSASRQSVGIHLKWKFEQLRECGHEVIAATVGELNQPDAC